MDCFLTVWLSSASDGRKRRRDIKGDDVVSPRGRQHLPVSRSEAALAEAAKRVLENWGKQET
jgi:hypothetical protein